MPWLFAVGADFIYPQTTGRRPVGIDLLNALSTRIQMAARDDPRVRRTFSAVQHLLKRPTALAAPNVLIQAARRRT